MSAASKNKSLAKAFLECVLSKDAEDAIAAMGNSVPPRTDLSADALKGIPPVEADMLSRDFPNLVSRTLRMPLTRSTSDKLSATASPGRSPVAASKPISVR